MIIHVRIVNRASLENLADYTTPSTIPLPVIGDILTLRDKGSQVRGEVIYRHVLIDTGSNFCMEVTLFVDL